MITCKVVALMKHISNKEYEEFEQYKRDKLNGRVLTPDGLRLICQANELDPEKIGRLFLEVYARQQANQKTR